MQVGCMVRRAVCTSSHLTIAVVRSTTVEVQGITQSTIAAASTRSQSRARYARGSAQCVACSASQTRVARCDHTRSCHSDYLSVGVPVCHQAGSDERTDRASGASGEARSVTHTRSTLQTRPLPGRRAAWPHTRSRDRTVGDERVHRAPEITYCKALSL